MDIYLNNNKLKGENMHDFEIEMQHKLRMVNFLEYAQMRYSHCQHSDCSTEQLTAFLSITMIFSLASCGSEVGNKWKYSKENWY